jgi:hypothetical protein
MEDNNQESKPVEDNSMVTESAQSTVTSARAQEQTQSQGEAATSSTESSAVEDSSNKIHLTIKTPKEKEEVLVKPDATIKEVLT